jgi:hypothetical protein
MRNAVFVLVLSAVVLNLTACGGGEEVIPPEQRKLLVIGWDSADWRLLDPMLEQGRLPVLEDFMAQSSHGRMRTFIPLEKSPVL